MKYYIYALLSLFIISGCAVDPDSVQPDYLKNSIRYNLEGRQGFMPGHDIRFGPYRGSVKKNWVNSRGIGIVVDMLTDDSLQRVLVKVKRPDGQAASIQYQLGCNWDLSSLLIHGSVKPAEFTGKITFGNKVWRFDEPTWIRYGTRHFAVDLSQDVFNDKSGDEYTVRLDDQVVAELRLSVYLGGVTMADYVWMDRSQPEDIQMMTALLVTYIATYEVPECQPDRSY